MIMFLSIFYFQPQIKACISRAYHDISTGDNDADMRTLGWSFFHSYGAAT